MANDEHVAQLRKGVAAWNAWREENPDIRPNLSRARRCGIQRITGSPFSADEPMVETTLEFDRSG